MAQIQKFSAGRAIGAVDLRDKEGCLVKLDAQGKLVLCSGSDIPVGVVNVGGEAGDYTDYFRLGHPGTVGIRLHASDCGTVTEGCRLVVATNGTVKQATSGTAIALACEKGEKGQLLAATLHAPVSL